MVQADVRAAAHAEVLRKVFDLSQHGLTVPLANSILSLEFDDSDARRIAELNAKANEGTLSEAENAELEAYVNVGDLLALWHSKARRVLAQQG
jgi:hypothetical protein